ncbi:TetR family transcriptional regulator [Actinophytocola sp. S1-96]|uniref:TetR family transcriptional regulator n=1 Tax=Actinophytocola gossypii TaxID=2812003 RepID=A0ABT2J8B3_9PSEU|nr:TetR family transcriptional regulator [Actinophytocola gossypii]
MDTPRKTPRQQRSRETVDAVVEAAAQLFEREGLAATTNRVAERAGVSIGTLYQYFPNKQALLYALAERHLDAAHRTLATVSARLRAERPGWEETVRALVTAFVDLHRDRPRLQTLMYEYAPRAPEGVARLHALHDALVAEVTGQLRRFGRPEPERTAALLVHAAEAQLHRVLLDRDDAAEVLTRALLALADLR